MLLNTSQFLIVTENWKPAWRGKIALYSLWDEFSAAVKWEGREEGFVNSSLEENIFNQIFYLYEQMPCLRNSTKNFLSF